MGRILKKLNILLDKTQKRAMGGLVVLMVISAGLQTLGVGMILSVVQTVMDREAFHKPGLLHQAYLLLGGGSELRFSVLVMLGLVLVYVVKNLFLFFEQRATLAFVYSNQFRISERMMRNYLRRSYEFYLNADTAVIQRNITANVNNMYALILALLQLVSDCIVFAFLVAFLLVQDAGMTILLATVMILLLALIKCVLKPVLQKVAGQHQDCYSGLLKWISQTVQGVKEIKIACKEQYFVDEYLKYGNGYVGAGLGKAVEIPEAIRKGKEDAIKHLVKISLDENNSITHDFIGKYGSANVLLKKAPEGTGIIAGGPARVVCELAGIKNIRTKSLGSNNKQNVVLATLTGLTQIKSPEEVARSRGKSVEDVTA